MSARPRRRAKLAATALAKPTAAALATLALALLAAGCGGARKPTPAALKLERQDLVVTSRLLRGLQATATLEVAATKASWPLIAGGLPADARAVSGSPAVARAVQSSAQLRLPALFGEAQARSLTGASSQIVGLFRTYALLAARGWKLLYASLAEIESGTPAAARFARANAALYVESVYDAHFALAQVGKKLLGAYKRLGGPSVFGAALTPALVEELARTYSEASDRLQPHVGARLGS